MELGNIKIPQNSLPLNEIQPVFLHNILQTAASLLVVSRVLKKLMWTFFESCHDASWRCGFSKVLILSFRK